MMTPEVRRYRMGSRQMMDPRESETPQFLEDMKRQPRRLKKGGPVKKYEGGGMVEIEIKVGGGKGKHKMPDGTMMDDDEMESEEYKKGGRVKKYQEGGKVSPRSQMKSELESSRTRTRSLMEEPESLVPRDTGPIRTRPRSMFGVDRNSDPIRQRERERLRREQDFNNRTNRAIEQEYRTQQNLETKLEEDQGSSRPKNYKKGGSVQGGKKFIQNAIKKPGALRAQLGAKEGQKIPPKKLAAAAKAPGKLGQRARFAQTLGKMRKK
jgi:hypothetical protein